MKPKRPGDARRRKEVPRQIDTADTLPDQPQHRFITLLYYPALILVTLVFLCIRPISDPDTWFHLKFGELVLAEKQVPAADVFSSTAAGNEWISSGWLSSTLMEWLYRTSGEHPGSLLFMVLAISSAAYLGLYATCAGFRCSGIITILLLAGAGAAAHRFNPRPDIWSPLLLILVLLCLVITDVTRAKYSALIALPFLMIAWANLHAGFAAGLLVIAIYAAWRIFLWKSTREKGHLVAVAICALCAISWMLNPYGWRLLKLPAKIAAIPGVDIIYEWMPLFKTGFPMGWQVYVLFLLILAITLSALKGARIRQQWWRWTVLALFVILALLQRRQLGLLAVAVPVLLLPDLAGLESRLRKIRFLGPVFAGLLALSICFLQTSGKLTSARGAPAVGINCSVLPCTSSDFLLQNRPPGNMFNSYNIGGYLLYMLGPESKVFIDGRLDVYGHSTWADALAVEENRLSVADLEKKYGVESFVITIDDAIGDSAHLASRLAASPEHRLVYFDDLVGVFVRNQSNTADYVTSHALRLLSPWNLPAVIAAAREAGSQETLAKEVRKCLEQSAGSANALAMAALVAGAAGDSGSASLYLKDALARDSGSRLAAAVLRYFNPSGR